MWCAALRWLSDGTAQTQNSHHLMKTVTRLIIFNVNNNCTYIISIFKQFILINIKKVNIVNTRRSYHGNLVISAKPTMLHVICSVNVSLQSSPPCTVEYTSHPQSSAQKVLKKCETLISMLHLVLRFWIGGNLLQSKLSIKE